MAFPSTPILETFTGANGTTPPSAALLNDYFIPDQGIAIQSNQGTGETASFGNSAYTPSAYGPAMETYVTVGTLPGAGEYLGVLGRGGTGATLDSYDFYMVDTSAEFYREDDGVPTQLGASESVSWVAGDGIGILINGSTITGYRRSGGTWSIVSTRTDSTYTAAGYCILYIDGDTARVDNFGGGTQVVSETPTPGGAAVSGTSPSARVTGAPGGGSGAGNGPVARAAAPAGGATGAGTAPGSKATGAAGGGVGGGTSPGTNAAAGQGGGSGSGVAPVARAASAAGGGVGGGVGPLARADAAAGGASGGGTAPAAKAAAAAGGGTGSGTGPSPWITVSVGGAIVAAHVPTGAIVVVGPGGATAGGFGPSDGTENVPARVSGSARPLATAAGAASGRTSVVGSASPRTTIEGEVSIS